MKFTRKQVFLSGALILCGLVAAVWMTRGLPVEVVLVTQGDMAQSVVTSGRIDTPARTAVASQTTGRIERIAVREGDLVQAGQLLVQLRDDEAQAALRQSDAAVTEARMRIGQIQTVQGPVSEQQLQQAHANDLQAQQELARAQDLIRQGFVFMQRTTKIPGKV